MTEINLLPWREIKREQDKKEFTIYLGMALAFAALIVFLLSRYVADQIDTQAMLNQRLQTEIDFYKKQLIEIKKLKTLRQGLIARMLIVQNLQATRILTVRLFDELIHILPDGVYVTRMERKGDKVTLLGYTESNANISRLMRNIEASLWIQSPVLTEIKKSAEVQYEAVSGFILSFILKPKSILS